MKKSMADKSVKWFVLGSCLLINELRIFSVVTPIQSMLMAGAIAVIYIAFLIIQKINNRKLQ